MFLKLNKNFNPIKELKYLNDIYSSKSFISQNLDVSFNHDDEIRLDPENNKIFVLTGFFFDDCFENIRSSKSDQLLFLAKLKNDDLVNFLAKVDGFYSLIIIDFINVKIDVFSDHINSKPLFFSVNNENIVVATDQKKIIQQHANLKIDRERVFDYFMFMNTEKLNTFYSGIYKTLPRSQLIIDSKGFSNKLIYSFDAHTSKPQTEKEYSSQLKKLFYRSVRNCIKDGRNINCALSGGLDSSSISSVVKDLGVENVTLNTAIFIGENEKTINRTKEEYYSNLIAKHCDFNHQKITLKDTGCITDLEFTKDIYPEPTNLVNGYIHHEIFKKVSSKGGGIYLDGFAGDSVISHGYSKMFDLAKKFQFQKLFSEDKALHDAKGGVYNKINSFKRYIVPTFLPGWLLWVIDYFRKSKNNHKVWMSRINPKYLKGGIYQKIINQFKLYPSKFSDTKKLHLQNLNSQNLSMGVYYASYLASSYSVDIRFPFLSKKLMELSLNIPVEFKLRNGIDRYIFRKSMQGIVPDKILERNTKSDLGALSIEQISKLDKQLFLKNLKSRGGDIFNYDFIEKTLLSDVDANFTEIYQLYEFALWMEKNDLNLD